MYEKVAMRYHRRWPYTLRGVRVALIDTSIEDALTTMKIYRIGGTPTFMLLENGKRVTHGNSTHGTFKGKGRVTYKKLTAWVDAHTDPFGGKLSALWRRVRGLPPPPLPPPPVIPAEPLVAMWKWWTAHLASGSPGRVALAVAIAVALCLMLALVGYFCLDGLREGLRELHATATAPRQPGGRAAKERRYEWRPDEDTCLRSRARLVQITEVEQ